MNTSQSAILNFNYTPFHLPDAELAQKEHKVTIAGLPEDHIFKTIQRTGNFYEFTVLESICCYLTQPLELVIDVGANIGNHAVFWAKILGAKVVCVEPDPRAARLLRTNIELNSLLDKVYIIEAAAGDRQGDVALIQADSSNIGKTHIMENTSDSAPYPTVPMRTIDEIVAGLDKPFDPNVSLLKVDVEGFERRVIAGATQIIKRDLPIIVVELETDEDQLWADNYLFEFGYTEMLKLPAFGPTYLISAQPGMKTHLDEYCYELSKAIEEGKMDPQGRRL